MICHDCHESAQYVRRSDGVVAAVVRVEVVVVRW